MAWGRRQWPGLEAQHRRAHRGWQDKSGSKTKVEAGRWTWWSYGLHASIYDDTSMRVSDNDQPISPAETYAFPLPQQRWEPLGHLGVSRGDEGEATKRTWFGWDETFIFGNSISKPIKPINHKQLTSWRLSISTALLITSLAEVSWLQKERKQSLVAKRGCEWLALHVISPPR